MQNKEKVVKPFKKCPVCGGELVEKKVEKLLRGGPHTAVLKVKANVCFHCGERLYPKKTVERFEEIRKRLEENKIENFKVLGKSFQISR